MSRLSFVLVAMSVVGTTLVLSELRWFRRPGLAERVAPYLPGHHGSSRLGMLSVASFREVIAPLAQMVGESMARLFGVGEDLATRLRRVHSPLDVATFRTRQLGWAGAALLGGGLVATALRLPPALAILAVSGGPVLAFLLLEQKVASASAAWQRRLFLELPVVAEQLAMLTAAGWSLGAALNRLAVRGSGAVAADLRRVAARTHQGLSEVEALREWQELADVDAVDRLVAVLALNREAADLGRLVAEEARSIRRDAQRELIETIEKRNQQVWIPVTVAALVPGVILMGIPFLDALTLFSTS